MMQEYWQRIQIFLRSSTGRLTATYLAIIMVMSLMFTFVLYGISTSHLDRRIPTPSQYDDYDSIFSGRTGLQSQLNEYLQRRITQEKAELAWQLFGINLLIFIGGAGVSYSLARRSLEPIEQAMVSKDQFISDASHELRTPLTALQTTNEVALRNTKLNIKEARELLEENLVEVKRLQQLTDGLLGLMKENHQVSYESVQLQQIVSESFGQVIAKAQDKNITVEDKVPPLSVRTDPALLSQVVTILLDNAIKYSPENTSVTVNASAHKKQILLTVSDHGVGIKRGDIEHIFDRFYRADQSRSKQVAEGYGLGLAIAKKIADSIEANITVKSAAGKGSTFTIYLPN